MTTPEVVKHWRAWIWTKACWPKDKVEAEVRTAQTAVLGLALSILIAAVSAWFSAWTYLQAQLQYLENNRPVVGVDTTQYHFDGETVPGADQFDIHIPIMNYGNRPA